MDIATIIGIVGCAGAVVYGIVSGDQGFAALENFWDVPRYRGMSDVYDDHVGEYRGFCGETEVLSSHDQGVGELRGGCHT